MSWDRFWRWYDRAARVDFAGTLLGLVFDWKAWLSAGGGAVTFLWGAIEGRSPLDVWVTTVVATAALAALLYFGLPVLERFRGRRKEEGKAMARGTATSRPPGGFIDISEAQMRIRQRREWLSRYQKEPEEKHEAISEEIRQLIRQQARLEKIVFWGRPVDRIEYNKIERDHWVHFRIEHARSVIDWNNPGSASPQEVYRDLKIERSAFDVLYPPDESGGWAEITIAPAKHYGTIDLDTIDEAMNALYPEIVRSEEAASFGKGIVASMEGIILHEGEDVFLRRLDELRLKINEASSRLSEITKRCGLFEDEFRTVTNRYYENRFWPAFNDLAGAVRLLPKGVNREFLDVYFEKRKGPFVQALEQYSEWAASSKANLANTKIVQSRRRSRLR